MTTSVFGLIQLQVARVNGISNMRFAVQDNSLQAMAYRFSGWAAIEYLMRGSDGDLGGVVIPAMVEGSLVTNDFPDRLRMEFLVGADEHGVIPSVFQQVKNNFFVPLTETERNPQPLTHVDTMMGFGSENIVIYARNFAHAQQQFNRIAMMNDGAIEVPGTNWRSHGLGHNARGLATRPLGTNDGRGFFGNFGDGLPLIPPTRELVNEMMSGSARSGVYTPGVGWSNAHDVLGWLKMMGGAITIETVAINAVMAGARPKDFPVILAAAELFANGWDYDKMWYHGMTTGAPMTLYVMVSGPLAYELGISGAEGAHAGANNQVNNTIGRAIRMIYRNIGHITLQICDHQYRGRENDHIMTLFREQEELLPGWNPANWQPGVRATDMWVPHHVEMGFRPEESTVTIWAGFLLGSVQGGEPMFWDEPSPTNFFGLHPVNFFSANGIAYLAISPGMAQALFDAGLRSKDAVRDQWPAAVPADRRPAISHPIVSGGDLAPVRFMGDTMFYNRRNHHIQLISGATLTTHGRVASTFTTEHIGVAGDQRESQTFGGVTDPAAAAHAANLATINPLLDPARTPAGNAWAPSAPRNVNVTTVPSNPIARTHPVLGPVYVNTQDVTVSWDAVTGTQTGNLPIIAYQIAFGHGGDIHFHTVTPAWSDADGWYVDLAFLDVERNAVGTGISGFATIEDPGGVRGTYVPFWYSLQDLVAVPGGFANAALNRMISGVDRIYTVPANVTEITFRNMPVGFETFIRVRAINGIRNSLEVHATENVVFGMSLVDSFGVSLIGPMTARSSGRGAWGLYNNGRGFVIPGVPYVQIAGLMVELDSECECEYDYCECEECVADEYGYCECSLCYDALSDKDYYNGLPNGNGYNNGNGNGNGSPVNGNGYNNGNSNGNGNGSPVNGNGYNNGNGNG